MFFFGSVCVCVWCSVILNLKSGGTSESAEGVRGKGESFIVKTSRRSWKGTKWTELFGENCYKVVIYLAQAFCLLSPCYVTWSVSKGIVFFRLLSLVFVRLFLVSSFFLTECFSDIMPSVLCLKCRRNNDSQTMKTYTFVNRM